MNTAILGPMTQNENRKETIENKRKRLIFRANHRGTKEMDILLGTFANRHVPEFDEDQLTQFDRLLEENDPNLYNWITGKEDAPESIKNNVLEILQDFKLI